MPVINLTLCKPIFYLKQKDLPVKTGETDEYLSFYELDTEQSESIEPVKERLFVKLTFTGKKIIDQENLPDTEKAVLPKGRYIFSQIRRESPVLEQKELIDIAVEQQKDALWERYRLTNQLYIRYLYEDGSFVTQFFRPCV